MEEGEGGEEGDEGGGEFISKKKRKLTSQIWKYFEKIAPQNSSYANDANESSRQSISQTDYYCG